MKKYIGIVIGVLIIIVGITAYLNMRNSQSLLVLQENAEILIKEDGNEVATFTLEQIRKFGETDFKGNYKTKGKDAVEYTYTGVPFKNVLKEAGIIKNAKDGIKVLGSGELTKKLTVQVNQFSKSAVEKIEAVGGKAEVI